MQILLPTIDCCCGGTFQILPPTNGVNTPIKCDQCGKVDLINE